MIPTPDQVSGNFRFESGVVDHPACVEGIDIHPRVVGIARERGLDLTEVAQTIREPEDTWLGQDGQSVVHLRGEIAVIAAAADGEAIAVASRSRALQLRRAPRQGAVARGHGGLGSRFPTTMPQLLDLLVENGFEVRRDANHYQVVHPDHPGCQVTMAKTPSDHRAIPNSVLAVRREFGIDLREVR